MIKELETASRVICRHLRQKPYQPNVSITAWEAIVEQLPDGRRYGAFSWHRALSQEVERYIGELDDATKRTIWESTEDCRVALNASMDTITEGLAPFVLDAAMRPIRRAVTRLEGKRVPKGFQELAE